MTTKRPTSQPLTQFPGQLWREMSTRQLRIHDDTGCLSCLRKKIKMFTSRRNIKVSDVVCVAVVFPFFAQHFRPRFTLSNAKNVRGRKKKIVCWFIFIDFYDILPIFIFPLLVRFSFSVVMISIIRRKKGNKRGEFTHMRARGWLTHVYEDLQVDLHFLIAMDSVITLCNISNIILFGMFWTISQ